MRHSINGNDNHLFESRSAIPEARTAAANHYKNGRHRYEGHVDVVLQNSGNRIKNFLDRMDWKGLVRGRLNIKFIQGFHNWENLGQIVELEQVISKCLVEAQKMAEQGRRQVEEIRVYRRIGNDIFRLVLAMCGIAGLFGLGSDAPRS